MDNTLSECVPDTVDNIPHYMEVVSVQDIAPPKRDLFKSQEVWDFSDDEPTGVLLKAGKVTNQIIDVSDDDSIISITDSEHHE